ncbi:MAG: SanA/YdcF family protein [Caldilineaceae bacterium]
MIGPPMNRRLLLLLVPILLAVGVALFPFLWRNWVEWRTADAMFGPFTVEPARVAIVFGARVLGDGRLSSMLRDRVETAIELYETGKVDKLLMSGDNSSESYNEPGAMMQYAIDRGVPAADIQPDYAGRRTYDTCYRAQHIFGIQDAILVTQEFHLPRAIFTCRALGMNAQGVIADRQIYSERSLRWSESREVAALVVALADVVRRNPAPVMGEPIPIQ